VEADRGWGRPSGGPGLGWAQAYIGDSWTVCSVDATGGDFALPIFCSADVRISPLGVRLKPPDGSD
jgi:hypothetical protein